MIIFPDGMPGSSNLYIGLSSCNLVSLVLFIGTKNIIYEKKDMNWGKTAHGLRPARTRNSKSQRKD